MRKILIILMLLLVSVTAKSEITKPELTEEQKVEQAVLALDGMIYNELQRRKEVQNYLFNYVWYNNDGITAKEIIESKGNQAASLFINSYTNETQIKAFDSSWEYLVPPCTVTINEDGTVDLSNCVDSANNTIEE